MSSSAGLLFVPFQGHAGRTLGPRAERPQDAPGLREMLDYPTFPLDQMSDARRWSTIAVDIPESLWSAFQALLDLAQVLRAQAWLAPSPARLRSPARPWALKSAADRVTDRRRVRRAARLLLDCILLHKRRSGSPPLQRCEISANSAWVP